MLAAAAAAVLLLIGGAGGYAIGHATAATGAPTERGTRVGGPGEFRGGPGDGDGFGIPDGAGSTDGTGGTGPST
jgi:hypothetical protein